MSREPEKKIRREQYRVMREQGTEAPFSGAYWNSHEQGMYVCASCGAELFSSEEKFDSETGWPSFSNPANTKNIALFQDATHGMTRVEVRCKNCGVHLGHVFEDGPEEKGGKRYCINSICLGLRKDIKQ